MKRSITDWEDELDSRPVVTLLKWLFGIIALVLVIGGAVWGIRVAVSSWKGQGDAYQQKNSADNWIRAQTEFHRLANDVDAFKAKIAAAKSDLAAVQAQYPQSNGTPYDPGAQQVANARTTLTGLQQQCQNTVAQYDTDAQAYLTADWRDAGLPERLDPAACT